MRTEFKDIWKAPSWGGGERCQEKFVLNKHTIYLGVGVVARSLPDSETIQNPTEASVY